MEETRMYSVGKNNAGWKGGAVKSLTFIVTEDCNLRCKYCYITHKVSNKRMNFDVAHKFIDILLDDENIDKNEAVILDFIGGEPLLEIDLIDEICDYFKIQAYKRRHNWYWNYRINICTNGVNYDNPKIEKFINKNREKLGISMTIDGIKEKHDLQRVFPDGSGSYDIIIKNSKLWLKDFQGETKVTFASDDLIYLKDSIIHLYHSGIKYISANVVFEDVWKSGDDKIFEEQLKELADYILENRLYNELYCTFFDDQIGYPYDDEGLKTPSCGAGRMLALGPNGLIYPCMRYKAYSLNNKEEYIIGDIDKGVDDEKVRAFTCITCEMQSDDECLKCPIASGCRFCQGFNYDEADTNTNFQRAKYICSMHKARVKANNYFFARLKNEYGIRRDTEKENSKLNILLADDHVSGCCIDKEMESAKSMTRDTMIKALQYAENNFLQPVFLHSRKKFDFKQENLYNQYNILHIIPAKFYKEIPNAIKNYLLIFEEEDVKQEVVGLENIILNVKSNKIINLSDLIGELFTKSNRVNVNIQNIRKDFNFALYEQELMNIKTMLKSYWKQGKMKEINLITDLLYLKKHERCNAGVTSFSVAPEGNLFICPAFADSKEWCLGNVESGINNFKNKQLLDLEHAPLCKLCDAYQCVDCVYHNLTTTKEVNVSSSIQCRKSHVERKVSMLFCNEIEDEYWILNKLKPIVYNDPIQLIEKQRFGSDKL